MTTEETKFQPKDYKSDQYVRWCPGCGDHAVLNCLHKAMAEVGVAPHNMAVISGIGCSSRRSEERRVGKSVCLAV